MNDSTILLIAMLVATIITLIVNVFSLMIDILYSIYKSKKTSKKQYWIVGRGGNQVNSMEEVVVYRLKFGLFIIVISLLLYIELLIYIKV